MGKTYRRRKNGYKALEYGFYGLLAAVVILIVVLVIMSFTQPADQGYVITSDGHVHASDGTHVGDYDEMVANGTLVVTEDGHIHDANGNHVSYQDELTGEGDEAADDSEADEGADAAQ